MKHFYLLSLIDDGEKGWIRGVNEFFGFFFLLMLPWHRHTDGGSSTKQTELTMHLHGMIALSFSRKGRVLQITY